jgi:AcrR family transcriptional regulator
LKRQEARSKEKLADKDQPGVRGLLSEDLIVESAIRLIRTQGVGDLSMRNLADELGVTAMAIYHYVGNKEALLGLATGRIMATVQLLPADRPWQERLTRLLLDLQDLYFAFPGLAQFAALHAQGAASLCWMEMILDVLHGAGFEGESAMRALAIVNFYNYPQAVRFDRPARRAGKALPRRAADTPDSFLRGWRAGEIKKRFPNVAQARGSYRPPNAGDFQAGLELLIAALARDLRQVRGKA